jgi:uncharacterized protein YndB with AHSA1/START domain
MTREAARITEDTSDREVIFTRVFDAPRELVWEAFTDPQQVVKWWGPTGFTTTNHAMDVRPGGIWRHTMHGPDGTDYANECKFIAVVKPERLVYVQSGGKADDSGMPCEVTWTFEPTLDGKTKLTGRMVFPSAEVFAHVAKTYGVIEGGKQTLERLAAHLSAKR